MLWETVMECYVAKIMVLGLFLGSNILSSACTLFKTPNHTDRPNEILKKKNLFLLSLFPRVNCFVFTADTNHPISK